MVPDRDGIDTHRFSDLVDGDLGLAEQGVENFVLRAFHDGEYTRLPEYCQYTRKIS